MKHMVIFGGSICSLFGNALHAMHLRETALNGNHSIECFDQNGDFIS